MDNRPGPTGKKPPGEPAAKSRATARTSAQQPAASRPQPKHGWSRDRFCEYLRAQRERAALSIEDIARVTKIPERSLRQLEAGQFEEMPADVFVRGFLRSYARVVGVNADDVVRRYAMCGLDPAPVASELAQVAAEQIAALAEKDPSAGEVAVVVKAEPAEPIAAEKSGGVVIDSGVDEVRTASAPVRNHGKRKQRKSGRRHAGGAPAVQVTAPEPVSPVSPESDDARTEPASAPEPPQSPERPEPPDVVAAAAEPVAAPRSSKRERAFLPPAWSEEETGRRGPLTLAVIILVIVATLTMSYLLRRPSYSGDGVTRGETTEPAPRLG